MLSRALMMMSLETLKISFALDIKLFGESVSRDIGTEGTLPKATGKIRYVLSGRQSQMKKSLCRAPR
jgi:hypothetical protein